MRLSVLTLLSLLLWLAAPAPVAAQDAGAGAPPAAEAAVGGQSAAPPAYSAGADPAAGGAASGLPQRTAQARTLRAHWHVYVAFAVTWLLLFGYALSLGRRFGRLDEELERLRRPTV